MGLFVSGKDMAPRNVKAPWTGEGSVTIQCVAGDYADLMVAERKPGYHSVPHVHASEQLNVVLEGEVWIFVEDEGYLLQKGDFLRVPKDALHWAWNKSSSSSILVEAHSPPLQNDPLMMGAAVELYRSDEQPAPIAKPRNLFLDLDAHEIDITETENKSG